MENRSIKNVALSAREGGRKDMVESLAIKRSWV